MGAALHPLPRGSPTARLALVVVVGLVIYASLFPIRGWTHLGLSPWAWISAPLPPTYWTCAEVVSNAAAYVPVGLLMVWALRPALTGWRAVVAAVTLGAVLSGTLESLQTFLPDRISSNLDFLANVVGMGSGAIAGALLARPLIDEGRSTRWRARLFLPHTQAAGLLALVWLIVQASPQSMLFATGDVAAILGRNLVPLHLWMPSVARPAPDLRVIAETVCTALSIIGVTMLVAHCLRTRLMRIGAVLGLVAGGLAVKAAARLAEPTASRDWWGWVTPGAAQGVALGVVLSVLLCHVPREWQRRVALGALCLQTMLVNVFPVSEYFVSSLSTGRIEPFFLGPLSRELAVVWPLLAVLWLLVAPGSRRDPN